MARNRTTRAQARRDRQARFGMLSLTGTATSFVGLFVCAVSPWGAALAAGGLFVAIISLAAASE
jgi:MFS-type transporter involved in bile tolerance (Atg22 family)